MNRHKSHQQEPLTQKMSEQMSAHVQFPCGPHGLHYPPKEHRQVLGHTCMRMEGSHTNSSCSACNYLPGAGTCVMVSPKQAGTQKAEQGLQAQVLQNGIPWASSIKGMRLEQTA